MLQYVLVSVCNLWSINEGKKLYLSLVRRNGNFLSLSLHFSNFVLFEMYFNPVAHFLLCDLSFRKKYPTGLILYLCLGSLCCYCFVISLLSFPIIKQKECNEAWWYFCWKISDIVLSISAHYKLLVQKLISMQFFLFWLL